MVDNLKSKYDSFTTKVVSDPSKSIQTVLLQGFLGPSSEPDHTRVYSDPSLAGYIDVPDSEVVHVESLPKEHSPLGGSYIWVKSEADLISGHRETNRTKAKFLEGSIASEAQTLASDPAKFPGRSPNTLLWAQCYQPERPPIIHRTPSCPRTANFPDCSTNSHYYC